MKSVARRRNRLADEPSPYLQQHADNPVDWWPWGEAAFAAAKRRDVPVFLSIGYATCHWCHVMAHESFEDDDVARLMNEAFVCIKVDREERPDIDDVYMAYCQATTGGGGWPLTVLLTSGKKPFFAGTYFPKESRFGRIGMLGLVPRVTTAWREHRTELLEQADHALKHLAQPPADAAGIALDAPARAEQELAQRFDAARGGFGRAPKFPSPHLLMFLLRRHAATGDDAARDMVVQTLHAMADGGIRDHVGGGFHRYSTDAEWLLPHFEKMLYDQAMLAMAYTEAFQVTGDERLADVARDTLDYVLRDLADPAGGLRSAEDADSEGAEGKFYVWTKQEIMDALGADGEFFATAYGITAKGNFHDEVSREATGANVLHRPRRLADAANEFTMETDEARARLARDRNILFDRRAKRVRPLLDDKVLTDWNGLAIAALSKAAVAFDESRYLKAAQRAAAFLRTAMVDGRGRLLHRFRAGVKDETSFVDDHAFLLWGLVELYHADFDPAWLTWAGRIAGDLVKHFRDDAGGFLQSPDDGEDLGVRRKEAYDGALPSGNSIAAWNLLRLSRLTGEPRWEREAQATLRAFGAQINEHPAAFAAMLIGLDAAKGRELLIVGDGVEADRMVAAARATFRPDLVVLRRRPGLDKVASWTADHHVDGKASAFLCEDHACRRPVHSAAELADLLDEGA